MSIIGSGRLIAVPTLIYLLLTVLISSWTKPLFTISENNSILTTTGLILIAAGLVSVFFSGRQLIAAYKSSSLKTDGMYRVCRNPLYASYLFFVLPGICLLFNSWLVLSTVIVLYISITVFVKKEYAYLEEKFGDEYRKYLEQVWIRFI